MSLEERSDEKSLEPDANSNFGREKVKLQAPLGEGFLIVNGNAVIVVH